MNKNEPIKRRTKTDLRLPPDLHDALVEIAQALGVNRNSLATLAVCQMCAELLPALPDTTPTQRDKMMKIITERFQSLLSRVNDK